MQPKNTTQSNGGDYPINGGDFIPDPEYSGRGAGGSSLTQPKNTTLEGWNGHIKDNNFHLVGENITIGESVLLIKKRLGLQSSEFAQKHGISRATLWRIETDKSDHIPVSMLKDIILQREAKVREGVINQILNLPEMQDHQPEYMGIMGTLDRKDFNVALHQNGLRQELRRAILELKGK